MNICTGPIEISPINFTQSLTNDIKAFQTKMGLNNSRVWGQKQQRLKTFSTSGYMHLTGFKENLEDDWRVLDSKQCIIKYYKVDISWLICLK